MAKRNRNYWAFIHGVEDVFGLTHRQARMVYLEVRDHMGRRLYGKDVREHPIIVGDAVKHLTADIQGFIDKLKEGKAKKGLTTLYERYGGTDRVQFEIENEILKISIRPTRKTRGKKFSVRG